MKRKLITSGLLVLLGTLILVACYKNKNDYNSGNNTATSSTVYMKNSVFSVASLQITSGSTVKWINDDNTTHTVTADDGGFNSGDIAPGASYSHTFATTGSFSYHDMHHPEMKASVVVVSTMGSGGY